MSVTTLPNNPITQLRRTLDGMTPQFVSALPSHINPEKFKRVVMTVAQLNPDLVRADRQTLLASCLKCAADGLVPDGREAALVLFGNKVQYMPMMAGIQKRARNSGEIAGITSQIVYEKDEFVQKPDDFDAPISHRPPPLGTPRGKPIGAYAMAKLKDGTIIAEVMDVTQIEKVRAVSRAKNNGPWVAWWDEMARKTVFRRLSKWLPMDAETDDLVRRDDEAGIPTGEGPMIDAEASAPTQSIEHDPFEAASAGEATTIENDPELAGGK